VTFTAPASNGGSPITRYTLTPSPACPACTGMTTTAVSSTVSGLTNGTAYTFRVTATNAVGAGAASVPSNAVTPGTPGFTGVTPVRVLDTRIGLGAVLAKVGARRTVTLTVPGLPAGTRAVALNVTATGPTAGGYLTVYPGGAARPTASNLNFAAGQTIPNMVLVRLGSGNTVTFYNSTGTLNVIADLLGYSG
jgi:Fibronectin type III domain